MPKNRKPHKVLVRGLKLSDYADLREATAKTWELALERSPLTPHDLNRIPFTLLVPDCKVTFMAHKRLVVHLSRDAALQMNKFLEPDLHCDLDTTIAGAILADVGKLLEYEHDANGETVKSMTGKYLRHPFTGVALAMECGVPDEVGHMIAAHAGAMDVCARGLKAAQAMLDDGGLERMRAGDMKPIGFLVGQVMRATGGKADPKAVSELIRAKATPAT